MSNFEFSLEEARQRKELVNKLAKQTLEERGLEYWEEEVPEYGTMIVFVPPTFSKENAEYVAVLDVYRHQPDGYLMELVWFECMEDGLTQVNYHMALSDSAQLEFSEWEKSHPNNVSLS